MNCVIIFFALSWKTDYLPSNVSKILELVDTSFSLTADKLLKNMSIRGQETLYCVAGWTLHTIGNIAARRKKELGLPLTYLANTCVLAAEIARECKLPTGKVDNVCALGLLKYPLTEFFLFIQQMETVYVNSLSVDYLVVYGTELIGKVKCTLLDNKIVQDVVFKFLPERIEFSIKMKFLDFIVSVYSRMCGKYFCFKLLSKGLTLEVTTRQTQAVLANPKYKTKKEKRDSNEMQKLISGVVNNVLS